MINNCRNLRKIINRDEWELGHESWLHLFLSSFEGTFVYYVITSERGCGGGGGGEEGEGEVGYRHINSNLEAIKHYIQIHCDIIYESTPH